MPLEGGGGAFGVGLDAPAPLPNEIGAGPCFLIIFFARRDKDGCTPWTPPQHALCHVPHSTHGTAWYCSRGLGAHYPLPLFTRGPW